MKKIVLASTSPRRKELLKILGLPFTVADSQYEERLNPRLKPRANAEQLSLGKAEAVAQKYADAIIIAADTIVVCGEEILGKPKSEQDAKRMLKKLSGTQHEIITGYTIIDTGSGKLVTKSVVSKIYFKKLTKKELDWYLKTDEWKDAAGAYKVQKKGSVFIERTEGDFFGIVGLPLGLLADELKRFGVYVTEDI